MAWITSLRGHQGCPEISIRNHVLNNLQIQRSYKPSITVCFPLTTYESREVQRIILQDIWDRMYKHRRIRNWILLWSGFRHCRPGDLGENMGITFKWMDSHSKLSRFPACTHECSQRGEEFKPWLVQGPIIINYWCFFCLMNFQEQLCAHIALMKAIIRWKVLQETWGGHTREARQEPGRPWAPW